MPQLMTDDEIVTQRLSDPKWRLNNLYHIVDKRGKQTIFKLNWAQEELYTNLWYCNLILKARQLGISTFVCLLFLDRCLFNDNVSAGIIAHTLEDGQQIFRRVKFAYDMLPDDIKKLIKADNDTSGMLKFSNGSSLRVGTSLRSSTFQYLHISEFGKICARYPEKAREVITGALNTLSSGQYCFIESTAEGRSGAFYDMVCRARSMHDQGAKLSPLDFKFHFFPWHKAPEYVLRDQVLITKEHEQYFAELELQGINLYPYQKFWYVKKSETQNEDMLREYPSTPDESFHTSLQGAYYVRQMLEIRKDKRIGFVPHDPLIEVHTAWDLGYGDSTAIWFFQIYGKEIRLIEYVEGNNEPLTYYLKLLRDREYQYGVHLVPHDAQVHEYSTGLSRIEVARKLGFTLSPVQKISIDEGIDACRTILKRCWIDESKCSQGIKAIESYRRKWDDTHGCWSNKPHHDEFSHGSDALRTMSVGITRVEKSQQPFNARTLGHQSMKENPQNPGNRSYMPNTFDLSSNNVKSRFQSNF